MPSDSTSTSPEPSPLGSGQLTYADAIEIVGPHLPGLPVVLVGGQALSYWVDRYRGQVPELAKDWPFTSEDVDFYGTGGAGRDLAAKLGVTASIPDMDDASPNSALVMVPRPNGEQLRIDVLRSVQGIDSDELKKTALGAVDKFGKVIGLRVMHPVLCMFSRAHNVVDLPDLYDTDHGLRQLRGSILCAREYARELVERNEANDARDLAERIFRFSIWKTAVRLSVTKGIDTFTSVECRKEYGAAFATERYPRMAAALRRKQEKAARLAAHIAQ